MTILWIIVGVIVLAIIIVLLSLLSLYNRLVRLRQSVRESWSDVDTELKRRHDLIPNVVETVKGYATHERTTLEDVMKARSAATAGSASPEQKVAAENQLTGALNHLFAVAENYPDLKANQGFQQLQAELATTETRISQSRRYYNANVREMNTAIQAFPGVVLAGPFGFHAEPYFAVDQSDREAVAVKF